MTMAAQRMPGGVSQAFEVFGTEAAAHAGAWMNATSALGEACALDAKTKHLAYLAVLAALRMESGIPFHVGLAKQHGATREEVISAILLSLQPGGHGAITCLPSALQAYDAD
ncbi:carboxymuconolactone decarboxylase family protein [Streptomyces sp. YIM S03343]